MRKVLALIVALLTLLPAVTASGARGIADIPNVQIADSTQLVSNPDGVLSPTAVTQLNSTLRALRSATTAEVVVVAVDELDTDDIDRFATDLFTSWGIGKNDNDNGLLILISRGQRRAVLRTGYGLEGVLPDAICGRIIRNTMAPHFSEGDYDTGTLAAVADVAQRIGAPDVADEVRSAHPGINVHRDDDESFDELWTWLWKWMITMTMVALAIYIFATMRTRRMPARERYIALAPYKTVLLALSAVGIGLPLLVWLLMRRKMNSVRNAPRKCPNCGTGMNKLNEEEDNRYLTPAQDTEERINSVDYDVWLCPECGETDIIPFINQSSSYTVCPRCGSRACTLTADRVVVQPTTTSKGRGVKEYTCRNCGNRSQTVYDIARLASAAPIIIGGMGHGGGGGGFGGGGFGGGMTGGGGASGGW